MKRVVYTSPYVPAEWIAAHGLSPSLVVPGATGGAPALGWAEGVCPLARALAAEVLHAPGVDAAVFTTGCDQMRRMAEAVSRETPRPVFLMTIPKTWQTAAAHQLYAAELRRLGRFMERLGGRAPSAGELADTMRWYDAARAALRAARGRFAPRRYAEAVREFQRSGKEMGDAHEGWVPTRDAVPVALVGGPLPAEEFALFDVVERYGGWVALDATENGELGEPAGFDRQRMREDPLQTLADAYFGHIPAVYQRPNSPLYQWLQRELKASGARGLIVRNYLWCDLWRAEVQRLAEWADRPVLHLDAESGESPRARTEARIQAFMEVLRGAQANERRTSNVQQRRNPTAKP